MKVLTWCCTRIQFLESFELSLELGETSSDSYAWRIHGPEQSPFTVSDLRVLPVTGGTGE